MKTSFKLFALWLLIVIFFFAIQMVFFHTTTQINIASNITLNATYQTTVSGHMLRISNIFEIIMTIFIVGIGALFLLTAGLDVKEYIGGDRFYES